LNDLADSLTLSSFIANMTGLITAGQLSGDVIISSFPPSEESAGGWVASEPEWVAAMQALAISTGCLFVDFFGRFNGAWNTKYMYDTEHPNDYGYWDWASMLANLLGIIPGTGAPVLSYVKEIGASPYIFDGSADVMGINAATPGASVVSILTENLKIGKIYSVVDEAGNATTYPITLTPDAGGVQGVNVISGNNGSLDFYWNGSRIVFK
jgi:hypothetical protein